MICEKENVKCDKKVKLVSEFKLMIVQYFDRLLFQTIPLQVI